MNRPDAPARLLVDVLAARIFNILFVTRWFSGGEGRTVVSGGLDRKSLSREADNVYIIC
jgi:hypothetical protein